MRQLCLQTYIWVWMFPFNRKLIIMKRLPLLLFGAATILLSCEAKQKSEVNTNTSSASSADGTVSTRTAPEAVAGNMEETTQATADAGQKPTLNPAHGEPYHRCDIEVGAPLNSPPAAQTPVPQAAQQVPANGGFNTNPISPSAAPAPSVSSSVATPKPALNPPHGEPHHRCDLQVGAPLT